MAKKSKAQIEKDAKCIVALVEYVKSLFDAGRVVRNDSQVDLIPIFVRDLETFNKFADFMSLEAKKVKKHGRTTSKKQNRKVS